ncbi:hypothetical protein KGF56_002823 [Candida oxycetoniae]|uniref:HD domain-containing protein n=1 Tax=Candida oxycetoniae TaxID=497107 RepID=A0AAI9WXL2_9ASCO|nr:uncharacterized protein KGF56_002823 [Candida oxycetoniae]KAI3404426.2 hypothetical protein KGF56_002823 [Candida oxycetoniae]
MHLRLLPLVVSVFSFINYLYQTPLTQIHLLNGELIVGKDSKQQLLGVDIIEDELKWRISNTITENHQLLFTNSIVYGYREDVQEIIQIDVNGSTSVYDVEFYPKQLFGCYGGVVAWDGNTVYYINNRTHIIQSDVEHVLVDNHRGEILILMSNKHNHKYNLHKVFSNQQLGLVTSSIKQFKSGIVVTENDQVFKLDKKGFTRVENDEFSNLVVVNENYLLSNERLLHIGKSVKLVISLGDGRLLSTPLNTFLVTSTVVFDLTDFLHTHNTNSIRKITLDTNSNAYPFEFIVKGEQLCLLRLGADLRGEMFSYDGTRKSVGPTRPQLSSSQYLLVDKPKHHHQISSGASNRAFRHIQELASLAHGWHGKFSRAPDFSKMIVMYDSRMLGISTEGEVVWEAPVEGEFLCERQVGDKIVSLFKDYVYEMDFEGMKRALEEDVFFRKVTESDLSGHMIPKGSLKSIKTWTFDVNEKIVAVSNTTENNMISFLTYEDQLKLYVIDGISGELLHTHTHGEDIDPDSINLLQDDRIVYTYFTKPAEQRIVIINIEEEKQSFSSSSFIYPERILLIQSTQTNWGITLKSVIAFTESGALVQIPLNQEHPIVRALPINGPYQLNYDPSNVGVILTAPSPYESTCVRDVKKAIPDPKEPSPQTNTELPQTDLSQFVLQYAKDKLPAKVLNHSLRVFLYSRAIIKDHFPEWDLDPEIILVTSLLHDIGTTKENMHNTKMSFEFYGGLLSRELVLEQTRDKDYADAVSEAIIRHQDLGESGFITRLGLILQVATILDNVGLNTHLIHKDSLDAANKKYPRDGWLNCFAEAIDNENKLKPWGHTSALGVEEFRNNVLNNKVKYEKL